MKKLLLLYVLFSTILTSYSQKILWEKTLGGNHSEYLLDMIPTADNGFLLAGATQSPKSGDVTTERKSNYDAWLWKMKASGAKEWDMRIGGDGDNYLHSINHTLRDGGFILGITSSSPKDVFKTVEAIGKSDAWIIKLDAARNVMWQTLLGGKEKEEVIKVLPLAGGDYVILMSSNSEVGGTKTSPYYGGTDIWVVRLSAEGAIRWQRSYGGEYDDIASDIIATSDMGLLIGGYSNSGVSGNKTVDSYGNNDYWLIKLNKEGSIQWQQSYGGEGNDQVKQIQEVEKEKYKVYGISDSPVGKAKNSGLQSEVDYWALTIDSEGQVVEELNYGYGARNFLTNGVASKEGHVLLGGTTVEKKRQGTEVNYLGTLLNKEGDVIWEKSISGKGENVLSRFIETRDGGYIFAGTSDGAKSKEKSTQRGMNDFWIVKVKAGLSDKDGQETDGSTDSQKEKLKIEAFPNPVVTYVNIVIPVEYKSGVLKVFDMSGRLLYQRSMKYQTEPLNLTHFVRGTYIVSVKTDAIEGSINLLKE